MAECTTSAGPSRRSSARRRIGAWSSANIRIGLVRVVLIALPVAEVTCNTVTPSLDVSRVVEPRWYCPVDRWSKGQGKPVGDFFAQNSTRAADALLAITDERAGRVKSGVV